MQDYGSPADQATEVGAPNEVDAHCYDGKEVDDGLMDVYVVKLIHLGLNVNILPNRLGSKIINCTAKDLERK
jgi:hypothetical protein